MPPCPHLLTRDKLHNLCVIYLKAEHAWSGLTGKALLPSGVINASVPCALVGTSLEAAQWLSIQDSLVEAKLEIGIALTLSPFPPERSRLLNPSHVEAT